MTNSAPSANGGNETITEAFVREMPKTDLHVHLDGSVRIAGSRRKNAFSDNPIGNHAAYRGHLRDFVQQVIYVSLDAFVHFVRRLPRLPQTVPPLPRPRHAPRLLGLILALLAMMPACTYRFIEDLSKPTWNSDNFKVVGTKTEKYLVTHLSGPKASRTPGHIYLEDTSYCRAIRSHPLKQRKLYQRTLSAPYVIASLAVPLAVAFGGVTVADYNEKIGTPMMWTGLVSLAGSAALTFLLEGLVSDKTDVRTEVVGQHRTLAEERKECGTRPAVGVKVHFRAGKSNLSVGSLTTNSRGEVDTNRLQLDASADWIRYPFVTYRVSKKECSLEYCSASIHGPEQQEWGRECYSCGREPAEIGAFDLTNHPVLAASRPLYEREVAEADAARKVAEAQARAEAIRLQLVEERKRRYLENLTPLQSTELNVCVNRNTAIVNAEVTKCLIRSYGKENLQARCIKLGEEIIDSLYDRCVEELSQ